MAKRLVGKIEARRTWRIYEEGGKYRIYHEFYNNGWHKMLDGAGLSYNTLAEAVHKVSLYIEMDGQRKTV